MWSGEGWELRQGEALATLGCLATASVDTVITDPPYSSGGQFRGDRMGTTTTKYVNSDSGARQTVPDFTGDNRDQRAYGYWCALWLAEAMRVTRPGGACLLFTDWRQLPTTTDAIQAGGWIWRGIVPWWKPNGRRQAGRFAGNCEYVVWGTNGPRPLDASATLDGFFTANAVRDRKHIAQKPLSVMRELVKIAPPDGLILDPFTGSGTTGVAALAERRRFLGVELLVTNAETAARRLTDAANEQRTGLGQSSLFDL